MKGEAKRDYPASILHQSPWYPDYHYLEDYFSRIHVALHDGKPECSLLVLNPIESVWARAYSGAFHGLSAADKEICRLEEQYVKVFRTLMAHQIDFDYGEEDILARHARVENGLLYVEEATYETVLVAGMDIMRGSTLAILKEFALAGGKIVFAGEVPAYVDVLPSDEIKKLAGDCTVIPLEEEALAKACSTGKEVKVVSQGSGNIYVQSFAVDGGRMVMLLNTDRKCGYKDVKFNLGEGKYLEVWDARSGSMWEPEYQAADGQFP